MMLHLEFEVCQKQYIILESEINYEMEQTSTDTCTLLKQCQRIVLVTHSQLIRPST
jgi:hypothetical protein